MKINFKAVPEAMKVVGKLLEKNKSTILVGAGLLGWVGTAVLVGRAAPKAQTAIAQVKRDLYQNLDGEDMSEIKLEPLETVKATWQYYIPAACLGVASSAAIVYAHKLDLGAVASIASTYQLTKGEYEKLKDKIVEKDGKEKLDEYKKDIRRDTLADKDPASYSTNIYDTGKGTDIFYEPLTDRFFYSDQWHVQRALTRMVEECLQNDGMYSLDELLDDLDIPRTPLSADFAFFRDGVSDISCSRIFDLLKPHFVGIESGDDRHCTWLDLVDRAANVKMYDEVSSFRRPRY